MPRSLFDELRCPRAYRPSDGVVQEVQEVVRSVRRVRETVGLHFSRGCAGCRAHEKNPERVSWATPARETPKYRDTSRVYGTGHERT